MIVLRSKMRRALEALRKEADQEIQSLKGQLAMANRSLDNYRQVGVRLQQSERNARKLTNSLQRVRGERDALQKRLDALEGKYDKIVERITDAQLPATIQYEAPANPDVQKLVPLSDDTIKRLAEQFVRDGLAPEVAQAEAERIVKEGDKLFAGVDGP